MSSKTHSMIGNSLIVFPWLMVIVFTVLLNVEGTFMFTWRMLSENQPVEILTFAIAFLAAGIGVWITWRSVNFKKPAGLVAFFMLFSFVMLFIAMEEIAWGQQFFEFATPEIVKRYNIQGEFTLHNVNALQEHNEWLRLAFGISAGIGIYFNNVASFRIIAVPKMLTGWVILIVIHAAIDIYNDHFPIQQQFDLTIRFLSEVFELLISMLAFIYVSTKYCEITATTCISCPDRSSALH